MGSLLNGNINEDNFDDYIDKIISIFRLSSKESSILFDLKFKDYKATIRLSIISQNGEKKEFSDVIMKCDSGFFSKFLKPLVQRLIEDNDVVKKDIVNLSDSGLVTFRLITENNDLFTIDGLSSDDANYLLSLVEKKGDSLNEQKKLLDISNNEGIGTSSSFFMMIIILVMAFISIILYVR